MSKKSLAAFTGIWLITICFVSSAGALTGSQTPQIRLDEEQAFLFRAWMVKIINEQVRQGPNRRWFHRDCTGLIRFAVSESFKIHDAKWLHNNSISNNSLPRDLQLSPEQKPLLDGWVLLNGKRAPFVTAQILIQQNTNFISKDLNQALPGDILFFDQGDDQHLMVWMGRYIAYHTGNETATDNGLRAITIEGLMKWKDTRWRPQQSNPNFIGVFRLAFLRY